MFFSKMINIHGQTCQTFVLVGDCLYKAGTQRMADAFSGRRQEPALAGKAVHIYIAHENKGNFTFRQGTVAVFNDEGWAHPDVRHWALAGMLDEGNACTLVAQKMPNDPHAKLFLAEARRVISAEALSLMALLVKKNLPTK